MLAVELLTAARGIELRAPLAPAARDRRGHRRAAPDDPGPGPDRFLAPEIEAAVDFVASGARRRAAESVTGPRA